MFNQPTTSDPSDGNAFLDGKDVFDASGEKVGSVSWQNRQAGYLAIQKGWLFANEVYVPFSAVVSQDSRGLFLNLSKEDLKDDRWKVPPSVPEVEASAVHSPLAASSAAEAAEPIVPAPPLMEPPVQTSEPGETFTPAQSSAQDIAQPLSIPPRESVVTDDGQPVDDRRAIADEQPVAVEIAPDSSDADPDQSSSDRKALQHPLPDEHPVDEDMVSA